MIVKQVQQVLDGTKGQTRRPDFPYELARQLWKYGWSYHPDVPWTWKEWRRDFPPLDAQIAEANRILENNTITLAIQPSHGKKAVGRIRITKIRRERLGDISLEDMVAEGIETRVGQPLFRYRHRLHYEFEELWHSIYGEGAWERMKDEDVWVLEFERSEG